MRRELAQLDQRSSTRVRAACARTGRRAGRRTSTISADPQAPQERRPAARHVEPAAQRRPPRGRRRGRARSRAPRSGVQERGEDREERGLAGAVGAEQRRRSRRAAPSSDTPRSAAVSRRRSQPERNVFSTSRASMASIRPMITSRRHGGLRGVALRGRDRAARPHARRFDSSAPGARVHGFVVNHDGAVPRLRQPLPARRHAARPLAERVPHRGRPRADLLHARRALRADQRALHGRSLRRRRAHRAAAALDGRWRRRWSSARRLPDVSERAAVEEANARFYRAFETLDLARDGRGVGARRRTSSACTRAGRSSSAGTPCASPGRHDLREHRRDALHPLRRARDPRTATSAWVTCTENILSEVRGRVAVTSILATNLFERDPDELAPGPPSRVARPRRDPRHRLAEQLGRRRRPGRPVSRRRHAGAGSSPPSRSTSR